MAIGETCEHQSLARSCLVCELQADVCALTERAAAAERERDEALDVVSFYANPESYHAISFLFDRPCGDFANDFSEDHGHEDYERPMPGKLAREILRGGDKAEARDHIADLERGPSGTITRAWPTT